MKRFALIAGVLVVLSPLSGCGKKSETGKPAAGARVKIGYLVKQPEEPWFQTEWVFAEKAGKDLGFEVVKLGVPDAEKTLAAIDNLAAQRVQGFVICTPDVRLGPAIVAKASAAGMKVMTVDDQFLGADNAIMADVHHLGVAARDVGHVSGQSLWDVYKQRGWKPEETAACIVTFEDLDTARERTEGIIEKLVENGFPQDHIFKTPQKTTDIPGSFDAANNLLTKHAGVKHWLAAGMNDTATLGAVRALEGRGFTDQTAVAIGINGTDCIDELKRKKPTPFYGSILMEANVHGYDSAAAMYKWVTKGVEPPKARFTGGILITRKTFEQKLKAHGMWR